MPKAPQAPDGARRSGLYFAPQQSKDLTARKKRPAQLQARYDCSDADDDEYDKDGKPLFVSNNHTPGLSAKAKGKRPASSEKAPVAKKRKTRVRIPGGQAPTSKRIVADYDTEDCIIRDMKMSGVRDEEVVAELCKRGLTKYDPKSISSRWQRMRKCMQDAQDELLDEELTDWHMGEDEMLLDAYTRAKTRVEEELQKVNQKFYRYVAQDINKLASRPRFSARACRDRYQALADGTARMPPEMDPDPESRQREREQRLVEYKHRKAVEAKRLKEEAEKLKLENSKKAQAKNASRLRREAQAKERAARKQDEANFKASRAAAVAMKRNQRKANLQHLREVRKYDQLKNRVEKRLRKRLEKEYNVRERRLAKYSQQFPLPPEAFQTSSTLTARESYVQSAEYAEEQRLSNGGIPHSTAPAYSGVIQNPSFRPNGGNPRDVFGQEPRYLMTMAELYDIMRERGMILGRMKEVKSVVLSRLNKNDASTPVETLRAWCFQRGIDTTGTKEALARRIAMDDATNSIAYQRRYAPQPPVADQAMARTAAKGKKKKAQKTAVAVTPAAKPGPSASRFTAKPADTTNGASRKRYSARERTKVLEQANVLSVAAETPSQTAGRIHQASTNNYTAPPSRGPGVTSQHPMVYNPPTNNYTAPPSRGPGIASQPPVVYDPPLHNYTAPPSRGPGIVSQPPMVYNPPMVCNQPMDSFPLDPALASINMRQPMPNVAEMANMSIRPGMRPPVPATADAEHLWHGDETESDGEGLGRGDEMDAEAHS